jgi:membrane protease subunit (stomatin/prohibitin family)
MGLGAGAAVAQVLASSLKPVAAPAPVAVAAQAAPASTAPATTDTKFCIDCGQAIPARAKFCAECGKPQ